MAAGGVAAQTSIEGLRRIRLLQGLSDAELARIASVCVWSRHRAAPDVQIISHEAGDQDVYFVVSGRVRVGVFTQDFERQITFRNLPAGEYFGELAAIDGAPRSANISAVEETVLARITGRDFMRLVDEHAKVRGNLLRGLVHSIRDLSDRVYKLSTLGVRNRLYAEILRLANEAGVANDNTARIDPLPKQDEIASQISTSRFQVSRELAHMESAGLVKSEGRALSVLDVNRIREEVEHPGEVIRRPPPSKA